jgi:hypothetical protein
MHVMLPLAHVLATVFAAVLLHALMLLVLRVGHLAVRLSSRRGLGRGNRGGNQHHHACSPEFE